MSELTTISDKLTLWMEDEHRDFLTGLKFSNTFLEEFLDSIVQGEDLVKTITIEEWIQLLCALEEFDSRKPFESMGTAYTYKRNNWDYKHNSVTELVEYGIRQVTLNRAIKNENNHLTELLQLQTTLIQNIWDAVRYETHTLPPYFTWELMRIYDKVYTQKDTQLFQPWTLKIDKYTPEKNIYIYCLQLSHYTYSSSNLTFGSSLVFDPDHRVAFLGLRAMVNNSKLEFNDKIGLFLHFYNTHLKNKKNNWYKWFDNSYHNNYPASGITSTILTDLLIYEWENKNNPQVNKYIKSFVLSESSGVKRIDLFNSLMQNFQHKKPEEIIFVGPTSISAIKNDLLMQARVDYPQEKGESWKRYFVENLLKS
mgnify:CR=1 FL=1